MCHGRKWVHLSSLSIFSVRNGILSFHPPLSLIHKYSDRDLTHTIHSDNTSVFRQLPPSTHTTRVLLYVTLESNSFSINLERRMSSWTSAWAGFLIGKGDRRAVKGDGDASVSVPAMGLREMVCMVSRNGSGTLVVCLSRGWVGRKESMECKWVWDGWAVGVSKVDRSKGPMGQLLTSASKHKLHLQWFEAG